jgi:hypothetical protein
LKWYNQYNRKINLTKDFKIVHNNNSDYKNITIEKCKKNDNDNFDVFIEHKKQEDNIKNIEDIEDFDRQILGTITYSFYNKIFQGIERIVDHKFYNLNYNVSYNYNLDWIVKKKTNLSSDNTSSDNTSSDNTSSDNTSSDNTSSDKFDNMVLFNKHQYILINSFTIKTPQQLIEWYASVTDLPVFIYYDSTFKKLRWYIKDNNTALKAKDYILFKKNIKHKSRQHNYIKKGFTII